MLLRVFELAGQVGLSGALDILIMAVFVYLGLALLRRSHAGPAVRGLLLIGGVYLAARQFGLALTAAVLEGFFAVLVVALVVIFREELRRFFEQVARWSPARGLGAQLEGPPTPATSELLARTLGELAQSRSGAIVVLPGREPVLRHIEGGTLLDGVLSDALLKSIFDKHSSGHDGAAIVEGGRVKRFGCHLPLSSNFAQLRTRGTRHAAALGLSERCDALCIVISEERGTISLAQQGELSVVSRDELAARLRAFGEQVGAKRTAWVGSLRRDLGLRTIALAVSALLWLGLVYGSRPVMRSFVVPVECAERAGDRPVTVVPDQVRLTFAGMRRDFYFFDREKLRVVVSYREGAEAVQRRRIGPDDAVFPRSLSLRAIEPNHVFLRRPRSGSDAPPANDSRRPGVRQRSEGPAQQGERLASRLARQ